MIGILVNVGVSNQYMIIAMVVLGALFLQIRAWYIATAKDIKHLEGISKYISFIVLIIYITNKSNYSFFIFN